MPPVRNHIRENIRASGATCRTLHGGLRVPAVFKHSGLGLLLLLLSASCSRQAAPVGGFGASVEASVASGAGTPMEKCLVEFKANPDAAFQSFLNLDLASGPLFAPATALGHSEAQFMTLSRTARDSVSAQAIKELQDIKQFARTLDERRLALRAQGQETEANKIEDQLLLFGRRLGGPEQLKITQLVGSAIVRIVSSKPAAPTP